MKRSLLVLFLLAAFFRTAGAQDANYWDTQYGTKGGMLGGQVVGSPSDLSATFYNPGWIAMDVDGTFLLTTQAIESYKLGMESALGEGLDLESTVFTTSPGYLAGRFTLDPSRTWNWAYSYLKKVQFDMDIRGVTMDPRTLPPTGEDWVSAEILKNAKSNEYWYGLTAARKVRENVAFGITPYVVYRSTSSRIQAAAQGVDTTNEFAQTYLAEEYRFWHVRALAKIGLAVDWGAWKIGTTMTTPSLAILGSGENMVSATYSGIDVDDDGTVDSPYVAGNYQEGLSTSWQSPVSLALGLSWKPRRTGLHATVEWFDSVSPRKAMDPEAFVDQSLGTTRDPDLLYAATNVLNFGFGFEHDFESSISLYGAFRSDFSSNPNDGTNNLSLSSWDMWHVNAGAAFGFLNLEFNAGIQYSWGSTTAPRVLNLNPGEGQDVLFDPGDFELTYQRIKILIGFNLPMMNPED
jgi:hypothetical protein